MNIKLLYFFLHFSVIVLAQETKPVSFPEHMSKTSIAKLKENDSLIYFQCYVAEATQELTTANGEKISGKSQKYTITEKYVVQNIKGQFRLKYFTSSLTDFPNKKFAYLKLVEKKYWNFKPVKEAVLNEHDAMVFAAIENKGHDTNEYDFKVNDQSPNEIIINGKKVMLQLVIEGNYLIRKNLEALR